MPLQISDLNEYQWLWKTGRDPSTGERTTVSDALSVPDAPLLFPKVVSNIVKEAVEPLLVGTSLLQRVQHSYGQHITFPAVGALVAADIAEGQEYPERNLQMGGSTVTASIGKSGVAVAITEEMVRYSQFDIIGMHLRAAGKALGRWKEQKIFNMIRKMGVPCFDNINPTKSLYGPLTGRDVNGSPNGSITMDNIFDAYAQVVTQGFMPNVILMHPLTWAIWCKDATLRAFVLANGGGVFFASWTGNPAGRAPWGQGSPDQKAGYSGGQTITPGKTPDGGISPSGLASSALSAFAQNQTGAPVMPGYMNVPFMIIVSPLVWFDPHRKLTDIYLFEAGELGALIVDEDITTEEFRDPRVDITKIKIRERYGLAIFHEGQAIATLKNVHVVSNEVVLPAQATLAVSSGWTAIDPATALEL
jgi:hypothetical protein